MIKPKRLRPGDKAAIVSLSWGGLGDEALIHRYDIAKERLEREFGLDVMPMPHALKGSGFVAAHPELRASDLMEAFLDSSVSAVICAIGGDDTIRTLPYVDLEIIRRNPKIFMGYSDSTINHLMMHKAGVISFYGPAVMSEFGEYVRMCDYTKKAVRDVLFQDTAGYRLVSSQVWSDDWIPWEEENRGTARKMKPEEHGYEILQGTGIVQGHLLGGCIDVFIMASGTSVWPAPEEWKDAVLFFETSEDKPLPELVKWILRNLAAQGILKVLKGILVGKPQGEVYYREYKEVIRQVVSIEEHLTGLPVFYNVNFGHGTPIGILPIGLRVELDCENKTITFLESATVL